MSTDPRSRRLVLAGVGGDSHFVGLSVLQQGLTRAGFNVLFLGSQNSLDDICRQATAADAVLVSNMDGHARYYLTDLIEAQREWEVDDRLWYLGGYPSMDDNEPTLAGLRDLGFDVVLHGYVEVRTVVEKLMDDLAWRPYPHRAPVPSVSLPDPPPVVAESLTEAREEVLYSWSTGAAARYFAANAARLGERANLAARQRNATQDGELLLQPRTGVSDQQQQRALFAALRDAGADVLSLQVDSLTRNNSYEDIDRILKQPRGTAEPGEVLNGYPVVNHGAERLAELSAEFHDIPMQVRHSTRDPRLLAELTYAGGIAAFEGGAISYNLPYYRDYPIREALEQWRYVDTLTARYEQDFDIVIDREFFGVLTACLVPPSTAIVVNVYEALLAARYGVKSVTLGYAEQGNRVQDLAAVRVLEQVTRHYLDQQGHHDVATSVVWHQYMGPFPTVTHKARQMLIGSTETAAVSRAVRLMVKSTAEARAIPSVEDNRTSLELVKEACRRTKAAPSVPLTDADRAEEELITEEVRAIVDTALTAADGDIARAVELSVSNGWLDIPFSPSRWNAGRVIPVRDLTGAVRVANAGKLPWPRTVVDAHAAVTARRFARDGDRVEELIEQDLAITAEGRFSTWPLG